MTPQSLLYKDFGQYEEAKGLLFRYASYCRHGYHNIKAAKLMMEVATAFDSPLSGEAIFATRYRFGDDELRALAKRFSSY